MVSISAEDIERFQVRLLKWYEENRRLLPWRETKDPYKIWISEVILQQTRVDQALDYYRNFIEQFPTIKDLACADEQEVLKCWQGLGYYSRARNLHAAARWVMENFEGKFPTKYENVLQMKGVGEYTAAAICSFAYNSEYAAIDGNVYRFLARYFGIDLAIDSTNGKKLFRALADEVLNKKHPAVHNQAMMEMGALQCVPTAPKCEECVYVDSCVACKMGLVDVLPCKEKKVKVRDRYFVYLKVMCGEKMFLHQRTNDDVWKNLYELPLIELKQPSTIEQILQRSDFKAIVGNNAVCVGRIIELKHVLSHQRINAKCLDIKIENKTPWLEKNCVEVDEESLSKYPISRLVEKILQ